MWLEEEILLRSALIFIAFFWHNHNILTSQGKYEVSVEIKNKELNRLKEELKSLQVPGSLFCSLSVFLSCLQFFSVIHPSALTPPRWSTTGPTPGCSLTTRLLYTDTRGHFGYSIWETATAVFGYFKAQWCSIKGHGPMEPFNLIFSHITASWDGSDLIVMMIC